MARAAKAHKAGFPAFPVPPVVLIHPSRLNPAPYNPTRITPERLEGLKQDIRLFGFVDNLVIQKVSPRYTTMVVVGGHQRLRAVREICIEDNVPQPELPCIVLDLTDRQAKMLNAALNAERGVPDAKLLGEMLESIHHESPIILEERMAMGFDDEDDLRKFLKLSEPPRIDPEDPPVFGRSVTLSLEFNGVRERDAVKQKLLELASAGGKKTGDIVMGLLKTKPRR